MLTLLIVSTSSGCANQSDRVVGPTSNFVDAERTPEEKAATTGQIHELPLLCEIPHDGTWPVHCWESFAQFETIAQGNTDIGKANTAALAKMEGAYDNLVEAGKFTEKQVEFCQVDLSAERKEHFWDNVQNKGLIGIFIIAAGVAL